MKYIWAMRLVTWNCAGGFRKKRSAFLNLQPTLGIVQECSEDSLRDLPEGYKTLYVPSFANKGIGLIWDSSMVEVRSLGDPAAELVCGFEVTGCISCRLIAVWPCPRKKCASADYIRQVHWALDKHPDWIVGSVLLAGDWNSHSRWDRKPWELTHSAAVERLGTAGIRSLYHSLNEGELEETPTFRQRERRYHIDYMFASGDLLAKVEGFSIGPEEPWFRLSDHRPLIADFRDEKRPGLEKPPTFP